MPAPLLGQLPTAPAPQTADDHDLESIGALVPLESALLIIAGTAVGALVAAVVLPYVLPDLTATLLGDQPKAYWYLSRSSGIVAYLLLWLSGVLGLTLTNRMARLWGGGPTVADLHQFTSLLALATIVFHVVILLGDRYANYRVFELLVPFAAAPHEPFWVGLGQLALYLALPVTFSFYARRAIGGRAWRLIHYASFAILVLAVSHGLGAGTDSGAPAVLTMYLTTGAALVFLTCYRVLTARRGRLGVTSRSRGHRPPSMPNDRRNGASF